VRCDVSAASVMLNDHHLSVETDARQHMVAQLCLDVFSAAEEDGRSHPQVSDSQQPDLCSVEQVSTSE